MNAPLAIHDQRFADLFREYMLKEYYDGHRREFVQSADFEHDLNEHTFRRTERFHNHLVPWLRSVYDLDGKVALEVGSGTGASTIAFAPYLKHVHCFEIGEKSIRAAEFRMNHFGISSVQQHRQLFNPDCRLVKNGEKVDIVLLVAALEHMTFEEVETVLTCAYASLNTGGVILIAETPNRLCPFDYHTSWLPFYQWLPEPVKERYSDFSTRNHFASDMRYVRESNPSTLRDRLIRWGSGVSYHEFEIIFGKDIHSKIIADGWEDEVRALAPVFWDDEILLDMFKHFEIAANKAFARSWLYFIIQKS